MYSYYAFLLIFVSRVTPMAFNVLIKLRRIFTFMAKIRSIFAILQQAHRTYGYGERAGGRHSARALSRRDSRGIVPRAFQARPEKCSCLFLLYTRFSCQSRFREIIDCTVETRFGKPPRMSRSSSSCITLFFLILLCRILSHICISIRKNPYDLSRRAWIWFELGWNINDLINDRVKSASHSFCFQIVMSIQTRLHYCRFLRNKLWREWTLTDLEIHGDGGRVFVTSLLRVVLTNWIIF